jgi:hypothetical protein
MFDPNLVLNVRFLQNGENACILLLPVRLEPKGTPKLGQEQPDRKKVDGGGR